MEPKRPDFDYTSYIKDGEIINQDNLSKLQIAQLKNYLKSFKNLKSGKLLA